MVSLFLASLLGPVLCSARRASIRPVMTLPLHCRPALSGDFIFLTSLCGVYTCARFFDGRWVLRKRILTEVLRARRWAFCPYHHWHCICCNFPATEIRCLYSSVFPSLPPGPLGSYPVCLVSFCAPCSI
ncbi:hypothetical protein DFH06DRAFT_1252614 [Mycena polygramma]|nr:hypothetical protein DFH06DRAFT_1252614 [Mycena polygramma]